jgi:hypothetical protein
MSEERVTKIASEIPGGCNVGCVTCAFRSGSETRFEPVPVLESQLCVLGGLPFYCHYDRNGVDFHASEEKPGRLDLVVCEGWKREIREASRDPRWRRRRLLRKAYAQIGLDSLKILTSAEEATERKEALRKIGQAIEYLVLPARPSVEGAHG